MANKVPLILNSDGSYERMQSGDTIATSWLDTHLPNTDTLLPLGNILSVNGTYKGITMSVTVDTNAVGVGAVLAQAADFHYDEADADAVANCYMPVMACETSTGTKIVLVYGMLCNTGWNWTGGAPIFLSTTQGTLTQIAPSATDDVVLIVGYPLSATCIFFNPSYSMVERT